MKTELGKISHASVGYGGYQEAMFGVSFTLRGDSFAVSDFWGHWGTERSESAQWTEESRVKHLGETCMRLKKTLDEAKASSVDDLIDTPVEVIFGSDDRLESWRILKEVL